MDMYIVTFVRNDRKTNEEYYYNQRSDAEKHIALFQKDDSELYKNILLTMISGTYEAVLRVL